MWKRWFAWYPVTVKGKRCWFQFVYRKRISQFIRTGMLGIAVYSYWKYGTILDVIGDKDVN